MPQKDTPGRTPGTQNASSHAAWFYAEIGDGPGADGTGRYASRRLAAILGCGPEEVAGILEQALGASDNQAVVRRQEAQRRAGVYEPYELTLRAPCGAARLRFIPRPLFDAKGESAGAVAVIEDVTGRSAVLGEAVTSHELTRLAVESGRIWVWDLDPASGELYIDPAFARAMGYEQAALPATLDAWIELVSPEDRADVGRLLERYLEGDAPVFEYEHRVLSAQDEEFWLLTRGAAVWSEDGRPLRMTGTHLDITRRKAAEQRIEAERGRLFSLLERLPAFVVLIAPDYSIRFANRFFTEHFGEPGGRPCYEVMCGRSQPCEICPTFDVFVTKSLAVWEWEGPGTGKVFQVYDYPFYEADGAPLVLEFCMDITRIKKAQEALAASEERYRGITDNLALGIAVRDRKLCITAVNPMMREWFGDEADNAEPCEVSCRFGGGPGGGTACPCRKTFLDGRINEALYEGGPGGRSWRVTACPIKDHGGQVTSVIEMVEDVTEKRQVEARLEQARKLQALGTLAGGIAHEINQPLNALQLYVSGLEMVLEKNEPIDREMLLTRLAWVLKETERIKEIIDHVRSLVRQEEVALGPVDVNEAVRKALSLVGAQLSAHGISLNLNLAASLPGALAGGVQLEQVVLNLAVNAMHAMDETDAADKRLTIATRLETDQEQDREFLVIEVSDNGPGFKEVEDRMFDPFFSTKGAGGGMGLGLSIVHTFVDSWQGEVHATGNPEGGATFVVRLRPEGAEPLKPRPAGA